MSKTGTRKRWSDRKDGRRLRTLNPFDQMLPYIMVDRNDSLNMYEDTLNIERAEKYIRQKREQGLKGFGMMHVIIAAYIRTVSQNPKVNRFVSGQRIYARNNIVVVMAVKRELKEDSPETTIKMYFDPGDTAYDVYNKINEKISSVKESEGDNNTERAAAIFMKFPQLLLKFVVWFLKMLDYFDMLPASLLDVSPFHGSMIITNLGSLGIPPIYHHIYNFGNLPVFLAFGAKRRQYELQADGTVTAKRFVDIRCVLDERICDGFAYAKAFKNLRHIIANPTELDEPPKQVFEDVQ